ncbi:MAG: YraN family protein [Candidatus Babeliales bacterium]
MSVSFKTLGTAGEQAVIAWLRAQGFQIHHHSYRTRWAEIDIIAQKGNTVAFIEVKTRSHIYFHTSEIIVPGKQRRMIRAAQAYASKNQLYAVIIRFDIALVTWDNNKPIVTYIPNAFQPIQEV